METFCPYCMTPVEPDQVCPHCGRLPSSYISSSHHVPAGKRLKDRYVVGRVLGEGGFGITYLGWDANLERRIAIKEFFPTSFVKREASLTMDVTCLTESGKGFFEKERTGFLKEARTMARLDSVPEIVHVLDFFSENETAYIVMEFLEGRTLRQIVHEGGRIPAKALLEMMKPVLRGMEEMHRVGLIHRDISPDNLMQMKNGTVKLMDFGCARDIDGGATMTVMLKHGYAPLEQYTGHDQGPWTDVYAISATIYYCLTKQVPPRALSRLGDGQDQLVPPNKLGAALSPRQEQALLKGLAVRPQDRWQNAASLYAALYGETMDGFPWEPAEERSPAGGETVYMAQPASEPAQPVRSAKPATAPPAKQVGGALGELFRRLTARPRILGIAAGVVALILVAALAGGGLSGGRNSGQLPTERAIASDVAALLKSNGITGAITDVTVVSAQENARFQTYSVSCTAQVGSASGRTDYRVELVYEKDNGRWSLGNLNKINEVTK